MITLLDKNNKLDENKNTLTITYSRKVSIVFGHYPYPDKVNNFIIEIKNNLQKELKNYTNVKGGMTDWNHFVHDKDFNEFLTFLINKNQMVHPDIFQYFLEKHFVSNAWGNEIKKGDSVSLHSHSTIHGILYLTEGCDLILPELNMKITPKSGDYYLFPPEILHGFSENQEDNKRYSLIFNISKKDERFDFYKRYEGKNS
tara:strand:- start:1185 stop:1784 length:600 start_codon:yes stop_codon:yes gene_type:complete